VGVIQTLYLDNPQNDKENEHGKVGTWLSMSLDGFVAGPNDGPERPLGEGGERIFKWYFSGDTDYELPSGTLTFKVSPASADFVFSRVSHTTL
jgi:hypothetical protein